MPDQEAQNFYAEEPVDEETVEQVVEAPTPVAEPVAPANQALIAELQQTRATARMAQEELHALRTATLQQAVQSQPSYDPVEAALTRVSKEMDPDAFKFTAPGYKMLLQEMNSMRQNQEALMQRNQYLEQNVNELAQTARTNRVYTQLSQAIPDLDVLGPRLTEVLGKESPEIQKMYIDNPALLIPMANAIRASGTVKGKNVQAERAKVGMDLGSGERATQLTANDISAMKAGSAAFSKVQEDFWGKD